MLKKAALVVLWPVVAYWKLSFWWPLTVWPLRVLFWTVLCAAIVTPTIDPLVQTAAWLPLFGLYWLGFWLRYRDYPGGRRQAWQDLAPKQKLRVL